MSLSALLIIFNNAHWLSLSRNMSCWPMTTKTARGLLFGQQCRSPWWKHIQPSLQTSIQPTTQPSKQASTQPRASIYTTLYTTIYIQPSTQPITQPGVVSLIPYHKSYILSPLWTLRLSDLLEYSREFVFVCAGNGVNIKHIQCHTISWNRQWFTLHVCAHCTFTYWPFFFL